MTRDNPKLVSSRVPPKEVREAAVKKFESRLARQDGALRLLQITGLVSHLPKNLPTAALSNDELLQLAIREWTKESVKNQGKCSSMNHCFFNEI